MCAWRGFAGLRTYPMPLQNDFRELDRHLQDISAQIAKLDPSNVLSRPSTPTSSPSPSTSTGAVPQSRIITAGTGLTGGGDLSVDRTLALANTAVTPGSYTSTDLTVDQQGRVTAVASGTGGVAAYPVGALFLTTTLYANSAAVAAVIGYGTWGVFGTGRVLVGVDTGDADFNTVEETGGAKTVAAAGSNSAPTFTGDTLAVHGHDLASVPVTLGAPDSTQNRGASGAQVAVASSSHTHGGCTADGSTESSSAGTPTGTVSAPTFTGSATSVVQPYITCYMWKRTA